MSLPPGELFLSPFTILHCHDPWWKVTGYSVTLTMRTFGAIQQLRFGFTDMTIGTFVTTHAFNSTREQMSPFYFKFQFRNVEYSSGRNKTLLCFRVDTAGGSAEPLRGYMEDEHATAHAEVAFFEQVMPFTSHRCEPCICSFSTS